LIWKDQQAEKSGCQDQPKENCVQLVIIHSHTIAKIEPNLALLYRP